MTLDEWRKQKRALSNQGLLRAWWHLVWMLGLLLLLVVPSCAWADYALQDYGASYPVFHGADVHEVCNKMRGVTWDVSSGYAATMLVDAVPFGGYLGGVGQCLVGTPSTLSQADTYSVDDCSAVSCSAERTTASTVASYAGAVADPFSGGGTSMTFPDIFRISNEGGVQIASAILAVLTLAWCWRMLIRVVRSNDGESEEE